MVKWRQLSYWATEQIYQVDIPLPHSPVFIILRSRVFEKNVGKGENAVKPNPNF